MPDHTISITIRRPNGVDPIVLEMNPQDSADLLLAHAAGRLGADLSNVRLLYHGRVVQGRSSLASLSIVDGCVLQAVVRSHQTAPTAAGNGAVAGNVGGAPTAAATGAGAGEGMGNIIQAVLNAVGSAQWQPQQPGPQGPGSGPGQPQIGTPVTVRTVDGINVVAAIPELSLPGVPFPVNFAAQASQGAAPPHAQPPSQSQPQSQPQQPSILPMPPLPQWPPMLPTLRGMQRMQPMIEGIHVHVHVNLSELDELPARLQRLTQQMQEHHNIAPRPTVRSAVASSAPSNAAPTTAASPSGSPFPIPRVEVGVPPSTIPPAATPQLFAAATAAAETVANQVQLLRDTVANEVGNVESSTSIIDRVAEVIMDNLDAVTIMNLQQGNWTVFSNARDALQRIIAEDFPNRSQSDNDTEAAEQYQQEIQQMAVTAASELADAIQSSTEIANYVERHQVPERAFLTEFRNYVYHFILDAIKLFTDTTTSASAWVQQVRELFVRLCGGLALRANRYWFQAPFRLPTLVQMLVSQLLDSLADNAAIQSIRPFAPLLPVMINNVLAQWAVEYENNLHRPCDENFFTVPPPAIAANAAEPAPSDNGNDIDLDELLDEALESVGAAEARPPSPRTQLQDAVASIPTDVLSEGARRELQSTIEQDVAFIATLPDGGSQPSGTTAPSEMDRIISDLLQ